MALALRFRAVMLALAIVAVGACNSTPTGPKVVPSVTIEGKVVSGLSPDLRVSVGASGTSVPVSATGDFSLLNVPSGQVELRFVSAGATATLAIPSLLPGEVVTLEVTLSGSSAVLNSLRRVDGSTEIIQGEIQALLPPNAFTVADRAITTTAATLFYAAGQPTTYNALALGQRITVKGQGTASQLLATQVDIDVVIPAPEFPVAGVISNLTGSSTAFEFMVAGTVLRGDSATIFENGAQFSNLANGVSVQTIASQRTGFIYVVRIAIGPGASRR